MSNNSYNFMKEVMAAPLGDFIASVGEGVADAQAALDEGSLRQTLEIYNSNPEKADETLKLLREIGYQPTHYVIPETKAKVKISLSFSHIQTSNALPGSNKLGFRPKLYSAPINASNSNQYNLDINGAAEIEFKIVPVPPSENSVVRKVPDLTINITRKNDDDENVIGQMNFEEAKNMLSEFGLEYELNNDLLEETIKDSSKWLIKKQFPEKDSIVRAGDIILLTLIKPSTLIFKKPKIKPIL